ncbi:MAG: hypothetical protein Sylvanvirus1_31 [Sylvanvirus sp.]|uniref:Uncharacterized protein n=1 Tax=Sylvanvirus sp. TaxID=2487774 RepID=A0A3G5AGU7_9VIRU|nr:MAG: hypothetical protein Sylvanvirus1_31 [Sylvanvirus sp.]
MGKVSSTLHTWTYRYEKTQNAMDGPIAKKRVGRVYIDIQM